MGCRFSLFEHAEREAHFSGFCSIECVKLRSFSTDKAIDFIWISTTLHGLRRKKCPIALSRMPQMVVCIADPFGTTALPTSPNLNRKQTPHKSERGRATTPFYQRTMQIGTLLSGARSTLIKMLE